MEELDATAEAAEEDAEEARYRATSKRTNKAKAATCWEGLPETVLNNLAARNINAAAGPGWEPGALGKRPRPRSSSPTAAGDPPIAYAAKQRLLEKPRTYQRNGSRLTSFNNDGAVSRVSLVAKEWDELVKGTSAMKCALTISDVFT